MQDFPGNSQKAKPRPEAPQPEERPKIERVTTAEAVQRKRGLGRKFKDTFILGSARETGDYMITDVIIPAIKDTLVESLQGGIERLFNGESPRGRRAPTSSAYSSVGSRINYQGMSRPASPPPQPQRMLSRRAQTLHDFGEIIIESRREADDVLEMMYEILSRNGEVSVADLYVLTGIQSSHVDHRFGWTDLKGSRLKRTARGQFMLDLPTPIALD